MNRWLACKSLFLFGLIGLIGWNLGFADVIYLKNGRKVSGDIISETKNQYMIKSALGMITIQKGDVDKTVSEKPNFNHVRNGDFYMERGQYNSAAKEYEMALKDDASNAWLSGKLEEAKKKSSESVVKSISPSFAKADDLMKRGFYQASYNEYVNVAKANDDNPAYAAEAEVRIQKLFKQMMDKASDFIKQQEYNRAFFIYEDATTVFKEDMSNEAMSQFKNAQNLLFASADQYIQNGQIAKGIAEYKKIKYDFPGEPVANAVQQHIDQVGVEFAYDEDSTKINHYLTRVNCTIDPSATSMIWGLSNPFQKMDLSFDESLRPNGLDEMDNVNIELSVSQVSAKISRLDGTEDAGSVTNLQDKKMYGIISEIGKAIKPIDISKVLIASGSDGMRLDQNIPAGFMPFLVRYPMVKEGLIKLGEKWDEPVNEKRLLGALELTTNGQINYEVSGFEEVNGKDCIKLAFKSQLWSFLNGNTMPGDNLRNNVKIKYDSILKGYVYLDHGTKNVTRYISSADMQVYGQIQGYQTVQQQVQQQQGMGMGMEMGGAMGSMDGPRGPRQGMPMPQGVEFGGKGSLAGAGAQGNPNQPGFAQSSSVEIQTMFVAIPEMKFKIDILKSFVGQSVYELPVVPSIDDQSTTSNSTSANSNSSAGTSDTKKSSVSSDTTNSVIATDTAATKPVKK